MKSYVKESLKTVEKVFNRGKQAPNKWDTKWVVEGKEYEKQGSKTNKKSYEKGLQKLKGIR
jgi:hypothetical protein